MKHIPESEHEEAWNCLNAEYHCPELFGKNNQNHQEKEPDSKQGPTTSNNTNKKRKYTDMLNIFNEDVVRIENKSELQRYKEVSTISATMDPLEWWKHNEKSYPILAELARIYLAIPASQATCERSFSTAKRICTDERTALTPQHLGKYVFYKQNTSGVRIKDE